MNDEYCFDNLEEVQQIPLSPGKEKINRKKNVNRIARDTKYRTLYEPIITSFDSILALKYDV